MYLKQKRLFRFLLLTVNISSQGLVSTLNSIVSLQDLPQCLKSLFWVHNGKFFSYPKKKKSVKNDHSLSLVVTCCTTRCQLLSLAVIRYHLLSLVVPLVVTRCTTRCHSLPLNVSPVCLFINDRVEAKSDVSSKTLTFIDLEKNMFNQGSSI